MTFHESKHTFNLFFNKNHSMMAFTDLSNGHFIEVNQAFSNKLGYGQNEVIGKTSEELELFVEPESHRLATKELALNGYIDNVELQVKTKSGNIIHGLFSGEIIEDENDKYALTAMTDITERKASELKVTNSLQQSLNRETEMMELLNATQAILSKDDFQIVAKHIFDSCARAIGAKAGYLALLSESGEENELLFLEDGGLPCSVDPNLPMPVRGLRAEAYSTGNVVYDNDFMGSEWVQYMPQGHMILPNVLFTPLIINGKTVGIMGFAYKNGDFTDNDAKLARTFGEYGAIALNNSRTFDALQKSEEKYKSIFEKAANLITSVDPNGIIVDCNSQIFSFLGYEKNEIIGNPMYKLFHSHHMDKATKPLYEIFENGFVFNKEYKMVRKDGTLIDVLINSSGVGQVGDKYERTICVINDITQRKKDEQRIEYLTNILGSIRDINQLIVKEKDPQLLVRGICNHLTENNGFDGA